MTILDPGAVTPTGGDHFKVFTPYHRAWSAAPWREEARRAAQAERADRRSPRASCRRSSELTDGEPSPDREPGGETQARKRMQAFLRDRVDRYDDGHDDLAGHGTSEPQRPHPLGLRQPARAGRRGAAKRAAATPFVRQLCWRDFHHQVLAAFPALPRRDYRPRGDRWSRSEQVFEAWKEGRTGYPLVDAGMRQLAAEGYMHNRARLAVGSFLTKDLYVDWRKGAWHFWDLLTDGDIANNSGNWQWVAGTGNDTRPQRVLNPVRQAERFDPDGIYVRRWVPELAVGARQGDLPALADGRLRGPRLPRADRRPRRRRRRVPRPPRRLSRAGPRIRAMGRLAVILGSNALGPGGGEIAAAAAEHGAAIVQRHGGGDDFVLPHEIDHAANLRPLVEQGCDRVLAIASVGSLRTDLPVGTLVCPDDFIALHVADSIFDDARAHSAPRFAAHWRAELLAAWARRRRAAGRRRRLLADDRAALRDPGRDPDDRRRTPTWSG